MKILYGITKSSFGGATRYVFELAIEAKNRGHEVKVVSGGSGILNAKLKEVGIESISLTEMGRDVKIIADIKSGIELLKILKKEKPDIFHINSTKMGGMGGFAARLAGVNKIIFTSHGWAFNESWRPKWQMPIIKLAHWGTIFLSHKTICVSEKTREQVSGWPFVTNKLVVVKNGIENFELLPREQARRELGVHEDDLLLVGTIGELHRVKGHDVLLEAWEKFSKGKHAHLVIISDGEERENLENRARKLGIQDSVKFTGYIDNARKLLLGLDMYVFPSRSENLPYAVLEAGFAGLPVIATNVGGIPEIIENGVNGVLVEPDEVEELISAMVLLHDNPRTRDRLGTELKKTVLENFSLEKMVRETIALY